MISAGAGRKGFFADSRLDASLPAANAIFWTALLDHVRKEDALTPDTILDIGCHSGALLERLAQVYPSACFFGIEPSSSLREQASQRLAKRSTAVRLNDETLWRELSPESIDLAVCHEVLYLEPNLESFMRRLARVLKRNGVAFAVLGSHTDNPLWAHWKPQLEADGLTVFGHAPFDILAAAGRAGLSADVQPLRRSGWVTYDPTSAAYAYPSSDVMFDHHYRHKLIFRLRRR